MRLLQLKYTVRGSARTYIIINIFLNGRFIYREINFNGSHANTGQNLS